MKDFLLIIPAYNEEENVAKVLDSIKAQKLEIDIMVINDGSTDKTTDIVENMGVKVLDMHYNSGYGVVCQTGFKYALKKGYKYVLQMDSDGQHRAEDLYKLIDELKKGESDIVIGSRFLEKNNYKFGFLKKIATGIFIFAIKKSTGTKITDPSSGFQGLNRRAFEVYSKMDNYPEDYPDADVIMKMLLNGFRIKEIPAIFLPRTAGTSMHTGLKPVYYMMKMILSIILIIIKEKIINKKSIHKG